jgi:hypothetical protein
LLANTHEQNMRLRPYLVAFGFFLGPSIAAAQTTTRDGVQALLRGDYQTAARILRPLAEDAPQPDPVAQFFMATLYEAGNGVARNGLRACGLYVAAASPANPFMSQSLRLALAFQEQSVPPLAQPCAPFSADDRGLPPTSFDLAPDHRIAMDRSGATISYRGKQAQTYSEMGGAGWVYLPPRHIELVVSRPVAASRHFIQLFIWWPETSDRSVWSLGWILKEVIGLEFLPVTGDKRLLTLTVPQPPASFDVESVADVRVNANGEAEWVVSPGPGSHSAVIPFRELR